MPDAVARQPSQEPRGNDEQSATFANPASKRCQKVARRSSTNCSLWSGLAWASLGAPMTPRQRRAGNGPVVLHWHADHRHGARCANGADERLVVHGPAEPVRRSSPRPRFANDATPSVLFPTPRVGFRTTGRRLHGAPQCSLVTPERRRADVPQRDLTPKTANTGRQDPSPATVNARTLRRAPGVLGRTRRHARCLRSLPVPGSSPTPVGTSGPLGSCRG